MNKSLIKDNGFECTQCKNIVLDRQKHDNEEDVCDTCKIANLEKKLAITEKALELACDYLVSSGDDELFNLVKDIYNDEVYLTTKINYFKTKAKEMLENE